MSVLEGALLSLVPPEDFIVAVGIEWRIKVYKINAMGRQLRQLLKVVTAVNDLGVDNGRKGDGTSAIPLLRFHVRQSKAVLRREH